MPELPEVESVKLSLEPKIVGLQILNTEVFVDNLSEKGLLRILRKQKKEDLIERTIGSRIEKITRRAKYIIIQLSKNNELYYILVHLGMAGALLANNDINNIPLKFRKHIHVGMQLENNMKLVFSDIRRMGGITVYSEEEFNGLQTINNLGPEPFDEFAEVEFLKNLRKKKWNEPSTKVDPLKRCIKVAIMDQENVAGIGNIYACEALHRSGINPMSKVNDLTDDQLIDIFRNARDLMAFSITVGGSSVSDYVDGNGMAGSFQNYLIAYGQEYCKVCNSKIEKIDLGRTTHFCPNCQK